MVKSELEAMEKMLAPVAPAAVAPVVEPVAPVPEPVAPVMAPLDVEKLVQTVAEVALTNPAPAE